MSSKQEALNTLIALNGQVLNGSDLAEVRATLQAHPELWRAAGDLTVRVRNLSLAPFESNSVVWESIVFGLEQLRADLGFDEASAVERLLIDQIVTAQVLFSTASLRLSRATSKGEGLYWDRRVQADHGRLVRSIEALARVRRLRIPAVQVNIRAGAMPPPAPGGHVYLLSLIHISPMAAAKRLT